MKHRHLWVSEDAYWILQELKASLRCETYDQLFTKLRSVILSPKGIELNQVVTTNTKPYPEPRKRSYLPIFATILGSIS